MIVSVHIADVGPRAALKALRKQPAPAQLAGLTYARTTVTAPISERLLPSPQPGRVGMIAAWENDAAIDGFLSGHPTGDIFATGWEARMAPLRVSGAWPEMPGLPARPLPVDEEEPIAALTLGRPRPNRALPFLRSAAAAEAAAARDGAVVASSGLARLPRLVSTFTIWRSFAAMREYAYGKDGAHAAAVRTDRDRPFHHASAFVRLRPYGSRGTWEGRDPLAGLIRPQEPSALNL
jgi:hypothetical protein